MCLYKMVVNDCPKMRRFAPVILIAFATRASLRATGGVFSAKDKGGLVLSDRRGRSARTEQLPIEAGPVSQPGESIRDRVAVVCHRDLAPEHLRCRHLWRAGMWPDRR